MAEVACAESAVGWASALFKRHVGILDSFAVMGEFSEFVVHVSGAEVQLFDLSVIWAGFGYPNLAFTLEDRGWEYLVTVWADASGFPDLLSLSSLYLNSFQFYHRTW